MNDGPPKLQARRFSFEVSNSPEGKPDDAATKQPSGSSELGSERSLSSTEQPSAKKDFTSDALLRTKRRRGASCEAGRSPTKRARLERTRPHRPGSLDEESTQQRQQTPPPRSRVSPLEPTVDRHRQESPATQVRKRRIDSDSDDSEHRSKQRRLTEENLRLFNEMVKKKEKKASASAPPESTVYSSSTRTTSTTTSGFAIQAYENGILDPLDSRPPTNFEEIRERYARSRKTASPTESVYKRYVNTVGEASNEATMLFEVGGKLLKEYDDKGYKRVFNRAFTGFPKDTGFNNGLSTPQPDFVEGLGMQEYDPFPVHKHIDGAVLYKDDPRSVTLSHLTGEWKGPDGNMKEATLQSAYDGAALVYARNQALAYLGKPDPPGHAEVTTFTTDGTNLNLYAHYAVQTEDGTLKYHQYPIKSTNLIDSYQGYNDGRRGLRNEQDHAREQSYAFRDQLKEQWKHRRGGLQSMAEGCPLPGPGVEVSSSTNVYDGQNRDEDVVEQPCEPTPPTSSKLERPSSHGKTSSSRSSFSKSLPPASDYHDGSSAQKRKASSSEGSSHGPDRQKSRGESY